jgi:hypothetical protein
VNARHGLNLRPSGLGARQGARTLPVTGTIRYQAAAKRAVREFTATAFDFARPADEVRADPQFTIVRRLAQRWGAGDGCTRLGPVAFCAASKNSDGTIHATTTNGGGTVDGHHAYRNWDSYAGWAATQPMGTYVFNWLGDDLPDCTCGQAPLSVT